MGRPRKKTDEDPAAEPVEASADDATVVAEPGDDPGTDRVGSVLEPEAEETLVADPSTVVADAETAAELAPPKAEAETAVVEPPAPSRETKPKAVPKPKVKKAQKPKPKRASSRSRERKPIVRLPKPDRERGRRKERRGVVVSTAMEKTIVVRVDTVKPDPRYKKVVRRSRKFRAHDEEGAANVGDVVRIVETRPLAKTKNWRLAEVMEKAR